MWIDVTGNFTKDRPSQYIPTMKEDMVILVDPTISNRTSFVKWFQVEFIVYWKRKINVILSNKLYFYSKILLSLVY